MTKKRSVNQEPKRKRKKIETGRMNQKEKKEMTKREKDWKKKRKERET